MISLFQQLLFKQPTNKKPMSSSRKHHQHFPTKFDKFYSVDTNSGEVATTKTTSSQKQQAQLHEYPSFASSPGFRTPPPSSSHQNNNNNNNNRAFMTTAISPSSPPPNPTTTLLSDQTPSVLSPSFARGSAIKGLRSLPTSIANSSSVPRFVTSPQGPNRKQTQQHAQTSSSSTTTTSVKQLVTSHVDTQTGSISLHSIRAEMTRDADQFLSSISWAESLLDRINSETQMMKMTRPDCISTCAALVALEVLSENCGSYGPILRRISQQLESALFQKNSYDNNTAFFDLYRQSLATRLYEIRRPQIAVAKAFERSNLKIKRAVFVSWRAITRKKNIARESAMMRAILVLRKKGRESLRSHFLAWKDFMSLRCRVLSNDEAKTRLVFRLSRYAKQLEKELNTSQEFCRQLISDNQLSFDRIQGSMKKWDEFKDYWLLLEDNNNNDSNNSRIKNKNHDHDDDDNDTGAPLVNVETIEDRNHDKNHVRSDDHDHDDEKPQTLRITGKKEHDVTNNNNGSGSKNEQEVSTIACDKNNDDDEETRQLLQEDSRLASLQKVLQSSAQRKNDHHFEDDDDNHKNPLQLQQNYHHLQNQNQHEHEQTKTYLENLENQLNTIDQSIVPRHQHQNVSSSSNSNNIMDDKKIIRNEAERMLLAAQKKRQEELNKGFYPHEVLDWVSSRIQCVSVSLDLPNKKFPHQFSSAGSPHQSNTSSIIPSNISSSHHSISITGKKICSNFTSDFQGKIGLEKLARFAVSLGAPRNLLISSSLDDADYDDDDHNNIVVEEKTSSPCLLLARVIQELNDLLLDARRENQNQNQNQKQQEETSSSTTTNLLQPSDITSLRGRKVALFLHEMYRLFKHVPVNVIPKRDPRQKRFLAIMQKEYEESTIPAEEKLSLTIKHRANHQNNNDDDDIDPILLLEKHVAFALGEGRNFNDNNNNDNNNDPEMETGTYTKTITNHQNLQQQQQRQDLLLPSQRERDELTKWYSELAASDSDLDSQVVEEEIAAAVDDDTLQEEEDQDQDQDQGGNYDNNNDNDQQGRQQNLTRNARERRRARARRVHIPTTKEIIERTLKRSQKVLSDEWESLNNLSKKKTSNNKDDMNDDDPDGKRPPPPIQSTASSSSSFTVKQRALLNHRLAESHKNLVDWVTISCDSVLLEKEERSRIAKELERNKNTNTNNINNNKTHQNSRLVPDHHYLHQEQKQQSYQSITESVKGENVSTLEMLESVLKTALGSSSATSQNSGDEINKNKNNENKRHYLLSVQRMLNEEARIRNVKLRAPNAVRNDDTVISMRQLLTALYVLKGGKNFVVVV